MITFRLEKEEKKELRSYHAFAFPHKDPSIHLATLRIVQTCSRTWLIQAFWTMYRTQSKFKRRIDLQGERARRIHRGLGRRLLGFVMETLVQSGRMAKSDVVTVLPAALMYVEPERNSQEAIEAYYQKLGFLFEPKGSKNLYGSTSVTTILSNL